MWGIVYIRRVFETLISIAADIGEPVDPAWSEILDHFPAIPTTTTKLSNGSFVPVLAWYGQSTYTHFSGQANNLHAVWPGELVSMSTANQTLVEAAVNSLALQSWGQSNSFSWVYSAAARVGAPLNVTFEKWNSQLQSSFNERPNRLIAFGG